MRVLLLQFKEGAMRSMSCNIEQRSVAVVLHCAVLASCCAIIIWMMLGVVRQSDSSGSNSSSSRRRRSISQAVAT
jgi:hypothetical protein